MFPVRSLQGLAGCAFIALAAGCGNDAARVLAPGHGSRAAIASVSRVGRAPNPDGIAPCDSSYQGPVLTLSGPGFVYHYPSGGYCPCPSAEVPVDVPEHQTVTFQWSADASGSCTDVFWYRWALDIADVLDETPRIDEATDLAHWSVRSLATSATVGPFTLSQAGPNVHRLYVDVSDRIGFRSLGILRLNVVQAVNRPPDASSATADLTGPGPPTGGFSRVLIRGVTDPDGDAITITATGVTQDEPLIGPGERATCPDAKIEGGVASVRMERSGTGDGRVYTIQFTAADGKGGVSLGSAEVCIPHGRSSGGCVRSPLVVNSLASCLGPANEPADEPLLLGRNSSRRP